MRQLHWRAAGILGTVAISLTGCGDGDVPDRTNCTVRASGDGTATISCNDGTRVKAGPRSATGATGPAGSTGLSGPAGAPGDTGSIGPTGPLGVAGLDGAPGPTGETGPIGATGTSGPIGETGPVGETGPIGATGTSGLIGETGPIGATGTSGPIGETGPIGATGAAGVAGTSCTIATTEGLRQVTCTDGTSAILGSSKASRRHVILIIGDGMHYAHEVATSRYLYGTDRGLSFHGFPSQAFVTTWDVTTYNKYADMATAPHFNPTFYDPTLGYDHARGGFAPYPWIADSQTMRDYFMPGGLTGPSTDSASAATAMSTGNKTDDGNVAWLSGDPPNGALELGTERMRRDFGMAIGVVSTVPLSHATPAAFVTHNVNRGNYQAIAHDILINVRPEVAITGGFRGTNAAYVAQADVDTLRNSSEYVYVERAGGVDGGQSVLAASSTAVAQHKKLLGLYGAAQGNFQSPIPYDAPNAPSVQRGSAQDPLLKDAAMAALGVLAQNPNGFFLMIEQGDIDWANHSNDYARMVGCTWDLEETVKSVVAFVERPSDDIDWSNTTVFVVADHANGYMRFGPTALGSGDLPTQNPNGALFSYPDGEVTWGDDWHTNELVDLYGKGAFAHRIGAYTGVVPGRPILDNTAIFALTLDAAARF